MLTFVCWKWQGPWLPLSNVEYSSTHVNTLYRMLKRHYHKPFELVCVTDNDDGIYSDIRIVPIWDDGLIQYGRCYHRLKAFSEEMADMIAPEFVSMDLDVVIVDDITHLFEKGVEFKIWSARPELEWMPYCGSLFQMKAGARSFVWHMFSADDLVYGTHDKQRKPIWYNQKSVERGMKKGSDQSWIAACLYPNEQVWLPEKDGIYNFNYHLRRRDKWVQKRIYPKDKYGKKAKQPRLRWVLRENGWNGELPDNARIVFFPGPQDPSQEWLQEEYPWIKEHYY